MLRLLRFKRQTPAASCVYAKAQAFPLKSASRDSWSGSCGTHDIGEDSGPHQIDHLRHLVDVDHVFVLQLLRQSGEGAEHPCRHRSIPGGGRT